jgi:C4-type Zn-finger protein
MPISLDPAASRYLDEGAPDCPRCRASLDQCQITGYTRSIPPDSAPVVKVTWGCAACDLGWTETFKLSACMWVEQRNVVFGAGEL